MSPSLFKVNLEKAADFRSFSALLKTRFPNDSETRQTLVAYVCPSINANKRKLLHKFAYRTDWDMRFMELTF